MRHGMTVEDGERGTGLSAGKACPGREIAD
jgi:hypothetical protein